VEHRFDSESRNGQIQLSTKGEADVVFKGLIAAASAVALAATPAVAASNNAAAASRAAAQVAPAGETVEGSELRGGFIIPLAAIVLIILGIIILVKDNEGGRPSP
jgi:hypothetical protein